MALTKKVWLGIFLILGGLLLICILYLMGVKDLAVIIEGVLITVLGTMFTTGTYLIYTGWKPNRQAKRTSAVSTANTHPILSIEKEEVTNDVNEIYHALLVKNNSNRRRVRSCEGKLSLDASEDDTLSGASEVLVTQRFNPNGMSVCWRKTQSYRISINPGCSEYLDILRVVKSHRRYRDIVSWSIPSHFEIPSGEGYMEIYPPLKPKNYDGSIQIESANSEPTVKRLKIKFNGRDDVRIEFE